jgi:hypothetical protein
MCSHEFFPRAIWKRWEYFPYVFMLQNLTIKYIYFIIHTLRALRFLKNILVSQRDTV